MLEEVLKQIIAEKTKMGVSKAVIINFLKEYIQYLVLSYIYNDKVYKNMIFKGGSCLRICFNLPRLSEDLDFDYDKENFNSNLLVDLENLLSKEIKTKQFSLLETKIQGMLRLYLKFPLLYRLGIAGPGESDKLYVKVEVDEKILPYAKIDLMPISQYGFNFIVRHYDLPTLMAGKIHAILFRIWFQGRQDEIDVKGRDFYDLYWFLKNDIKPNWKTLKAISYIKSEKMLKTALILRIKKVLTPEKLSYDLKNFIPDQEFVSDFAKNYSELVKKYL